MAWFRGGMMHDSTAHAKKQEGLTYTWRRIQGEPKWYEVQFRPTSGNEEHGRWYTEGQCKGHWLRLVSNAVKRIDTAVMGPRRHIVAPSHLSHRQIQGQLEIRDTYLKCIFQCGEQPLKTVKGYSYEANSRNKISRQHLIIRKQAECLGL